MCVMSPQEKFRHPILIQNPKGLQGTTPSLQGLVAICSLRKARPRLRNGPGHRRSGFTALMTVPENLTGSKPNTLLLVVVPPLPGAICCFTQKLEILEEKSKEKQIGKTNESEVLLITCDHKA